MTSRSPVRARQSRLRHAQSVAALLLALASGACDESASEPRHEPSLDEDGDADGDGLTNGVELALGTNLHHVDSDGDGLSDATEVDSVDAPADADGDGFIDALESDQLDNDRDRTPDHQDKADADSWQVAYARFEPSVIANDGDDTTRLEVQIIGATPESVRIGMDSDHWMPHLAPDELSVEGKMLGTDFFELFDDGTHGDAQVHDGIFTRDAISTRMKPRAPITGEKPTSRGEVMLGAIRLRIEGAEQTRQLGYTREPGPQVFRGGLMLRFIEASELRLVTGLGEAAQRTDHTLNVVHTPTALAIHRDLTGAGAPTLIWDNVNLVRPALDLLEKEVDFLYVYPAVPTYGTRPACTMQSRARPAASAATRGPRPKHGRLASSSRWSPWITAANRRSCTRPCINGASTSPQSSASTRPCTGVPRGRMACWEDSTRARWSTTETAQ
jgi:hypothetical protein